MSLRHPGLTLAIANSNLEAARVCLDRHHESPVEFKISNLERDETAEALWLPTDDKTKLAWNNEIDTTEQGAYTCVLAAVELFEGMVAIHRAETRTGADYYVTLHGNNPEDLENCLRLEVSGLNNGNADDVENRLKKKIKQLRNGSSNLPGIAGVIGFKARTILLSRLESA
jgi:hypothetical protein